MLALFYFSQSDHFILILPFLLKFKPILPKKSSIQLDGAIFYLSQLERSISSFTQIKKFQLIPCKAPLNWQLNMKVVESAVVIFEFFLLSIFARASFARLDDLRK